jgi:hypothetical protein
LVEEFRDPRHVEAALSATERTDGTVEVSYDAEPETKPPVPIASGGAPGGNQGGEGTGAKTQTGRNTQTGRIAAMAGHVPGTSGDHSDVAWSAMRCS